jgi:hypothetical protein
MHHAQMDEFELTEAAAEKALREHRGDVDAALRALLVK